MNLANSHGMFPLMNSVAFECSISLSTKECSVYKSYYVKLCSLGVLNSYAGDCCKRFDIKFDVKITRKCG